MRSVCFCAADTEVVPPQVEWSWCGSPADILSWSGIITVRPVHLYSTVQVFSGDIRISALLFVIVPMVFCFILSILENQSCVRNSRSRSRRLVGK